MSTIEKALLHTFALTVARGRLLLDVRLDVCGISRSTTIDPSEPAGFIPGLRQLPCRE